MPIDNDVLLILGSSGFGAGEPDLGEKLIKSFLTVLPETGDLPAKIVCVNTGIFLSTEGSPVVDLLKQYEQEGVEILSCATCLDYYGRKDRLEVGKTGNMRDTVKAMRDYEKVLKP